MVYVRSGLHSDKSAILRLATTVGATSSCLCDKLQQLYSILTNMQSSVENRVYKDDI